MLRHWEPCNERMMHLIEVQVIRAILEPSHENLRVCGDMRPDLQILTHAWAGINPGYPHESLEAVHSSWLKDIFAGKASEPVLETSPTTGAEGMTHEAGRRLAVAIHWAVNYVSNKKHVKDKSFPNCVIMKCRFCIFSFSRPD